MKYFIITFGCEANKADSERIESRLRAMGHKPAEGLEKAKIVVINACSVRQSAVDRIYGRLKKFKNKHVILAGCLLPADKKKLKNKVWKIWHPDDYFEHLPMRSDASTAYVPIMTGCNNFCTYCAVPYTRGRERSRPAADVLKEVKSLIKKSYKEIWLLGQNVNSYKSGGITFSKLLKRLNSVPGEYILHFISPHPKNFSDELINTIAKSKNIAKEIHLPVQSGDNGILKRMNRNYTREEYLKLVGKIRKAIPGVKLSTDVIVGFPGETKKQFENTVDLFKKVGFAKTYAAKYSPRPGTVAAKFKDNVPYEEKKRRWQILDRLVNKKGKQKIIVVLGPTASGKSGLAVEIAKKFNGEVISADSRQVYKRLDIGSGKITKIEMKGVKHYLLDVTHPKKVFTAMDFKKQAEKAIGEILEKGKVPVVCGGTGFYIHTLLSGEKIPEVKPDHKLRKELEKKSAEELFKMLQKLDNERAKTIDPKNKRRLVRAVEISKKLGEVPSGKKQENKYDILYLGIKRPEKILKTLIKKRLLKRIKQGMITEVKNLRKRGVTWQRFDDLGLEYRYVSYYLRGKISKEEMTEKLETAINQYAKRQMTWFKKYAPETHWVHNKKEAFGLIKNA